MEDHTTIPTTLDATDKPARVPWNKGKLVGAKPPLRPGHAWSIRTKLRIEGQKRDLALFNLAIDRELRGCDGLAVRVDDVAPSGFLHGPRDNPLKEDRTACSVRGDGPGSHDY